MSYVPVKIIAIVTITTVFNLMIAGDEYIAASFEDNTPDTSSIGGLDILGEIIEVIVDTAEFLINVATFGALTERGAPAWIGVPVGVILSSAGLWSLVTLIRGTNG